MTTTETREALLLALGWPPRLPLPSDSSFGKALEQTKEPRNECTHFGQLIYNKEGRIYDGEKTSSSISGGRKTGQLYVKE